MSVHSGEVNNLAKTNFIILHLGPYDQSNVVTFILKLDIYSTAVVRTRTQTDMIDL